MSQIILKRLNGTDVIPDSVRETYIGSFPEAERRDWSDIVTRVTGNDPFFSLYVIEADGMPVGFVTTWLLPDALYVEHFAIFPHLRSNGLGAGSIAAIKALAPDKPVVLEVELPETSHEAQRRIAFYERTGFTAMEDFPYFQPPYRPGGESVPLMLMVTDSLADPQRFVIMLHTLVYNQ
ncbi:MAG: GNAT family N-acetyltransferase [Muribaculaceae bacterium]|nr:GNAT family N-acetyltransferase [Muribaculaceae bacterium]